MTNEIIRRMLDDEIALIAREYRLGPGIVSGMMEVRAIGTPSDGFSGGLAVRLANGDWYLARGAIMRSSDDTRLVWSDGTEIAPETNA